MEKNYSLAWKSSTKPRKQRIFRLHAPKHVTGKFMHSTLAKTLRTKHGMRAIRVRTGDSVKVMRGRFSGKEGKVQRIDMKHCKVLIDKMEMQKKDGSKTLYPIDPSNLMITELNTDDKKRLKRLVKSESK